MRGRRARTLRGLGRWAVPVALLAVVALVGLLPTTATSRMAPGPLGAPAAPSVAGPPRSAPVLGPATCASLASLHAHMNCLAELAAGSGTPRSAAVAWENITPTAGTPPSPRVGAGIADDPRDGYVLLFGGENGGGTQFYSDTWKFAGGIWTNLTGSAGSPPFGRVSPFMTYDPADGEVVLFGGLTVKGGSWLDDLADTWTFSGGHWSNVTATAGTPPTGRFSMAGAYDGPDHVVLAFGGESASVISFLGSVTMYRDTWTFHAGLWNDVSSTSGTPPSPRAGANVAFDPDVAGLLLYGGLWESISGTTLSGYEMADTWTYVSGSWSNRTGSTQGTPGDLALSGTGWDGHAGEVVMFGGCLPPVSQACPLSNATWAYRSGTWTDLSSTLSSAPSDRATTAVTNDSTDGELLLFGGSCGSGCATSDTWTENGLAPGLPQVTFEISPASCGPVVFAGTSEASGAVGTFPRGHDAVSIAACSGYLFAGWNVSGGLTVASAASPATVVGVSGSGTLTAWFTRPLSALATANPTAVGVGGTSALSVSAWGGFAPYTYAWNLNATTNVSTTATWSPSFPHGGNYSYVAWVTDAKGTVVPSGAVVVAVLATPPPPLALNLSLNSYYAASGSTILATATVTGGTPATFLWTENGSASLPCTTATCNLTLLHGGRYGVGVAVTDTLGRTASGSSALTILYQASHGPPPDLTITIISNATQVYVGEDFSLNATVIGGVPPYNLLLWNNATGNATGLLLGWEASWSFPHAGSYRVRIWVVDFQTDIAGSNIVTIAVVPDPVGGGGPPAPGAGPWGPTVAGVPVLFLVLGAGLAVTAVLVGLVLRRRRRGTGGSAGPPAGPGVPTESWGAEGWEAAPDPYGAAPGGPGRGPQY